MGWFKKSQAPKQASESASTTTTEQQAESSLTPSKPIKTHSKRLPNEILKKYAPLRSLDEEYINLLPHSIQTFSPESTLFVQGQKSTQIYYLLEGTVHLQPDSDNGYEITCDDTRAHLPLNSGQLCGATATATTQVSLLIISSELNQLWAKKTDGEVSCIELIDIELPKELNDQGFFESFSNAL